MTDDELLKRINGLSRSSASEFGIGKLLDQTHGGFLDERDSVQTLVRELQSRGLASLVDPEFEEGADPPDVIVRFPSAESWAVEVTELCCQDARKLNAQIPTELSPSERGLRHVHREWCLEDAKELLKSRISKKSQTMEHTVGRHVLLCVVSDMFYEPHCAALAMCGIDLCTFADVWLMTGYHPEGRQLFRLEGVCEPAA